MTYAEAKGEGSPHYLVNRDALDMEHSTVNKAFLRARGWTRTSITRILGEPDRRMVMLRFRKDRPECLYEMERVLAAEAAGKVRFRKATERLRGVERGRDLNHWEDGYKPSPDTN